MSCPVWVEVQEDYFDDVEPSLGEAVRGYGSFVPVEGFGRLGIYELVGQGKVSNDACGKYLHVSGCLRTDLHNVVTLDGVNYRGKVYVKLVHCSCHKLSCPVCYLSSCIREAKNIEARLLVAKKHFGEPEHIVASVPLNDYGLKFETLRSKVVKILSARGVFGGTLIFHGFRYNIHRLWYWSPHFHCLGFIAGGYGCRGCKKVCGAHGCDGFEARTRKCFESDGYIVKVLGKRKTLFGTAYYQLNHSTIRTNVKRPHSSSWFGVCSYRKLKVTVERKKDLCPICGEELVKLVHLGGKRIVKDRLSPDYVGSFVEDLIDADGLPNYAEAPPSVSYASCSDD